MTHTRTYAIVSHHFFKLFALRKAARLEMCNTDSRSVFTRYDVKEQRTNWGRRWIVIDWGE